MPFTIVGWFESQETAAALTLTLALADQHVRVEGDNIIVPGWAPNLMGYYAWGQHLTKAQLVSPSLRTLANLDIKPLDKADVPTTNPPFHDLFDMPIPLEPSEALTFLMAEEEAAGEGACFAWLGTAITPMPTGRMFTVRAEETISGIVIDVWNNKSLTFEQTLPAGRYACVGARAQSTGLRAFRFCPVGEFARPGAIGFATDGLIAPPRFRYGKAGVWFEFEHDQPPTVDLMTASEDTDIKIWMDLIQTRAGRA